MGKVIFQVFLSFGFLQFEDIFTMMTLLMIDLPSPQRRRHEAEGGNAWEWLTQLRPALRDHIDIVTDDWNQIGSYLEECRKTINYEI